VRLSHAYPVQSAQQPFLVGKNEVIGAWRQVMFVFYLQIYQLADRTASDIWLYATPIAIIVFNHKKTAINFSK
jgi:hypothetical protein